jgi:hypothetical protein
MQRFKKMAYLVSKCSPYCLKMNRALHILLVCLLACSFKTTLWAQAEAESAGGSLELQSTFSKKVVTIPAHTKIGVKYTVGPRRYHHQTLDAVLDTSVVISGTRVGVQYLEEITVRDEDRYRAGKTVFWISIGVFLGFLALLAILAALTIYALGAIIALAILVTLVGIAAAIAMPAGVIVGIVLMAVAAKKYSLAKEWKLVTHPTNSDD